jgi:hypothetical protein
MADTNRRNDTSHEIELDAYNAAFYQLGLRWYWDTDTYQRLLGVSDTAAERVRWYLQTQQSHLLKAYDADFLVNAIEAAKAACRKVKRAGAAPSSARFDWAEIGAAEIGV